MVRCPRASDCVRVRLLLSSTQRSWRPVSQFEICSVCCARHVRICYICRCEARSILASLATRRFHSLSPRTARGDDERGCRRHGVGRCEQECGGAIAAQPSTGCPVVARHGRPAHHFACAWPSCLDSIFGARESSRPPHLSISCIALLDSVWALSGGPAGKRALRDGGGPAELQAQAPQDCLCAPAPIQGSHDRHGHQGACLATLLFASAAHARFAIGMFAAACSDYTRVGCMVIPIICSISACGTASALF